MIAAAPQIPVLVRRSLRPPVLACLAWALLALPAAGREREGDRLVRLLAPRAGAALVAGSTADLEWAPDGGFDRPSRVEEWEAFLSLDGGATYPVRITPHLDQDLRRFRFEVPAVPTPDARLLLRFGDEREETPVELAERFSIVAAPLALPASTLTRWAAAAGEPALPGRAGVVAWVEGSRRGAALHQVVAPPDGGWRDRFTPPDAPGDAEALLPDPPPARSPGPAAAGRAGAAPPGAARRTLAPAGTAPLEPTDILLLTQRQNE